MKCFLEDIDSENVPHPISPDAYKSAVLTGQVDEHPASTDSPASAVVKDASSRDERSPSSERINYATQSAGARVLASNTGAKNPEALIVSSEEKYMMNPCEVNEKFVILSLSEDVSVELAKLVWLGLFVSHITIYRSSSTPSN